MHSTDEMKNSEKMNVFDNYSNPELNLHINISSSMTPQAVIFRACVLSFNVLFGPPTHSYVLWLIVTGGKISSEFLHLNLAVCEIFSCVNAFFLLCSLWWQKFASVIFALGLTITGRPLFQCLICVERYLAVVYPVTFLKFKPLRYRVICSTAVWIISICSCVFCMYTMVAHVVVYMCFSLLQFLLFLSINLFCCLAVLRALKQSGPGERGREREEENHMKRRAFNIILIITVSMVIMFVPSIIIVVVILSGRDNSGINLSVSFLCFMLAGFVQPTLYLHRVGKLQFLC